MHSTFPVMACDENNTRTRCRYSLLIEDALAQSAWPSKKLIDSAHNAGAARPQNPWWITILNFVGDQLWWLGVYLVFCGLKQAK